MWRELLVTAGILALLFVITAIVVLIFGNDGYRAPLLITFSVILAVLWIVGRKLDD
jgi:hypothetical protein